MAERVATMVDAAAHLRKAEGRDVIATCSEPTSRLPRVREVAAGFDQNCLEADTIVANAARRVVTSHSSPGAKMARIVSWQSFVAEAAV